MRKIFLFELNKDITKLISDAIKNEFNDEVHAISNIDEALKEVSLGDYDLMIVRNKTKDSEQNTEKFIGALSSGGIATSVISIGEVSIESDHLIGHVEDKFNVSTLIELMKAHFDNSEDQSYIRMEIDVINLLEKSTQELFSRLKRPGKPDQYVLKVKPGESIEEVRKVEEKGFKNLFIKKEERLAFTNDLVSQVEKRINLDYANYEEVILAGEQVYRVSRKLISSLGPNEMSYRLINCLAEEMIVNLKKSKNKLDQFISACLIHPTSYSFKHLNLISIFGYMAAPYIEMMEEKREQYLKDFIYAAYFHDIILEKEGMAEIHTKQDWVNCEFSDKEKNLIRDHAKLASELLEKFPGSSKDAIRLVREHHGVPNGVGFVDRKVGTLDESSIFFDSLHDFVELFINFQADGSMEKIFAKLEDGYHLSVYKSYAALIKNGIVETFKEQQEE